MKNTKKITRFLIGSTLVAAFSVQFLLIGIGSFFISSYLLPEKAQAEIFDKNIQGNFSYTTSSLNQLRALNFKTFIGKSVKIPLANNNPDGIPGGDQDYIIIFPPKILDRNASIPLRAIYLSSGKTIDQESAQFVQSIEQYVNSIGKNNPLMVEIIKNLLQSELKLSINTDSCENGTCPASALTKLLSLVQTARAADSTNSSPLLTSDDISQLTESLGEMDTSNPQIKQLMVLVLILIMVNQSLAESLNSEKQKCLDMGGDWVNETCNSAEKEACEDNNGTFRKFSNQCLADKQVCGNNDLQCDTEDDDSDYLDNSNDNEDESVYSCACKTGSCLDEEGICVPKNSSKETACENSGGTWRSFFDASELCLQKCGATESSCSNAVFGSSSSSQSSKGCDCSSAVSNTNSNTKKCLSTAGKCIAKDTSNEDDDQDGVPNGQDRCPNSTPDGFGTVNKQAGSAYYGCTCSQIQAMGGIPKPQCPPDGCEGDYLVTYDKNYLNNNQNAQCTNGVPQQQYGNATCPVISRIPNDKCEEQNNKNKNKNDNKSLEDLLKQLLNKDKDKNKGGQQQGGGGGPSGNPGQNPVNPPPDQKTPEQQKKEKEEQQKKAAEKVAISPEGVGKFNAEQNGSNEKPYYLHTSQFKKICGENTYVLTNSKPGVGNLKDDPSKTAPTGTVTPGSLGAPDLNKLLSQSVCSTNNPSLTPAIAGPQKIINDNWKSLTQEQQQEISKILSTDGCLNQDKLNSATTKITQSIAENKTKIQAAAAAQAAAQNNGKGAESIDKLQEKGAYFKVPKCEQLAITHCCVCSCCDKKDEKCGWAIGEKCDEKGEKGECKGDKCAKAPTQCGEKPELSIKLDLGTNFNQCSNSGDKKKTSSEKCEKYDKPTHNEGACRYDCEGSTKGCEEGSNECKIIINGREIQRFNDERYNNLQLSPDPQAQFTEFTNKKDGSTVQLLGEKDAAGHDWVKGLSKEKGKACKCQERDKNKTNPSDKPEGYKTPQTDQKPPTQPAGQQPPANPTGQQPPENNTWEDWWSNQPNIPVPSTNSPLSQNEINKLRNENKIFNDYMNNKNRAYPPTIQDWANYQKYRDWDNQQSWAWRLFQSDSYGYDYWTKHINRK